MEDNGNHEMWFKFLLWALGLALTATLTLQGILYTQMMAKVDRVTALFMEERNRVLGALDTICQTLKSHEVEIYRQKEMIENLKEKHGATKK